MFSQDPLRILALCIVLIEYQKERANQMRQHTHQTARKDPLITRVGLRLIGWLGNQMVGWGTKLQSYDVISQNSNLTQDAQNHRLKYL
jgi:hypothetical protein